MQFTLITKNPNQHAFLVRLSHSQIYVSSFPSSFRDLSNAYNKGLSSLPVAAGFWDYMYFCKQKEDG